MTPLSIAQVIAAAASRLAAAGLPDPEIDAEFLFRGLSGLNRAEVLARGRDTLDPRTAERYEVALRRRETHEPLQYILGIAAFWRDEFAVTPAVLIPRPETEVLVEAAAIRLRGVVAPRLLDIGAGSGCLGLSLLRELPDARLVALDLSPAALDVARRNAERLSLAPRAEFRLSNWFSALAAGETFDAVVSNPPYVARADEASLPRDVREFEPALALFADADDDISSYRRIVAGLRPHLVPGGLLGFEVGMGQADRVRAVMSDGGLAALEVLDDLAGIPRVLLGRRL
jgi:release factor glutamine methyltransferase